MLDPMKVRTTGELTNIRLNISLPKSEAQNVISAIRGILGLARVRYEDIDENASYPAEMVSLDNNPGVRLRGLRHREEMTQKQFAEALGINQRRLSEFENGKRAISVNMAKRIEEKFGVGYKIFL